MSVITPTIGRKIYYTPTLEDIALGMTLMGVTTFVDATVIYVDADGRINLRICDHVGNLFVRSRLAIDDSVAPAAGCAHWMTYQVQQALAEKASSVESAVDSAQPVDNASGDQAIGNVASALLDGTAVNGASDAPSEVTTDMAAAVDETGGIGQAPGNVIGD